MNIFEIIKSDHKKVGLLLEKLEKTTEDQPEKRERLFEDMSRLFYTHAKAEEEAVYSCLRDAEKTRPIGFQNYEEHVLVYRLLEEMANLSPSREIWTAKLKVVNELIQSHVKEEESEMFKKMKKVFDDDELKDMAITMRELEKNYPTTSTGSIAEPDGDEARVH
jgi:hemerythrin superfamily protein